MISLYVKTHNKTGLNYLGKTVKDPLKYKGSGKWWRRHLAVHGDDVSTNAVFKFESEEECSRFALILSRDLNVVNSDSWANLIVENGKDGAPFGHPGHEFTDDQLKRMSESGKSNWSNSDYKSKMSEVHKKRWETVDRDKLRISLSNSWTEERKKSHSEKMKVTMSSDSHKERISEVFKNLVRTDTHCGKISAALKGKPKSVEHRMNLAFQKIKQNSPDCKFESYFDLWSESDRLYGIGYTVTDVSRALNIGWGAAKALSLNKFNLMKEE
ncbi:hypothetical protein D3C75_655380 [compost metagenome]